MVAQPDVTTVLAWMRECAIIIGILVFGWKARDSFQAIVDFKNCVTEFMIDMRQFAHSVETNHLEHIQKALEKIADAEQSRPNYSPSEPSNE